MCFDLKRHRKRERQDQRKETIEEIKGSLSMIVELFKRNPEIHSRIISFLDYEETLLFHLLSKELMGTLGNTRHFEKKASRLFIEYDGFDEK